MARALPAGRAEQILDGVLSRIRTAAATSGPIDDTPASLPPELRNEAAAIVRYVLALEVPTALGNMDEARQKAHDRAQDAIKDLAAGRFPISRPAAAEGSPANTFAPRFQARTPRFDAASQEGA